MYYFIYVSLQIKGATVRGLGVKVKKNFSWRLELAAHLEIWSGAETRQGEVCGIAV